MSKVTFDAGKLINVTKKDLKARLDKVGLFLTSRIKDKISEGQPYERYGKTAIYYRGLEPSQPGYPPKVLTGQLRASITYDVTDDLVLRVGSNLDYASYLELGTQWMKPRPYLRSTVIENSNQIKKFLGGQ